MKVIPHYSQHPEYGDPALHLLYLGDDRRVGAFRAAIEEVVSPGMVVADIGTGTGVLARLAAASGAKRVYAIEREPRILKLAERITGEMGLEGLVQLIRGDSREVLLPEPVDVIVAELIGGVGNDENMAWVLEDARERFLKPGGKVIPNRVRVYVAPVEACEGWAGIPYVYDDDVIVTRSRARPPFQAYYEVLGLSREALLGEAELLDDIDLWGHSPREFVRHFSFHLNREGVLSGLLVWFVAELTDGVSLDTSPFAPPTCWGQAFFPTREQMEVKEGDCAETMFQCGICSGVDEPVYDWRVGVRRVRDIIQCSEGTNRLKVDLADDGVQGKEGRGER